MSEIKEALSFPLDEGFLRRECPFCRRQFKVLLEKEELTDLSEKGIESFMVELKEDANELDENEDSQTEFICPYCTQSAPVYSWWTKEQLDYARIFVRNITTEIINEQLIRPLKKEFRKPTSGLISMQFKGKEIKLQEPWIAPEVNDMKIFDLPCCQRQIKIEDDWVREVHCFFCGFAHKQK